jgi:N6-L-threonylcarbamoyladenine synthase/protein kinase Bud32
MKLLKKGAEAELYLDTWRGLQVVRKIRRVKPYRLPQLDATIRRSRTKREAQIMHDAKQAGVATPLIYMVDVGRTTIVMEYVAGPRVKEILAQLPAGERRRICERVGRLIARLHRRNIVHGDLTTSNMIRADPERIVVIDFGLAEYSGELENRGVDLLLLRRTLHSTHHPHARCCFEAVIDGYRRIMGEHLAGQVVQRVDAIAGRGRYTVER